MFNRCLHDLHCFLVKPNVPQALANIAETSKSSSVEKIPVRATIFSALSIVPYLIGFLGFALPNLDFTQVPIVYNIHAKDATIFVERLRPRTFCAQSSTTFQCDQKGIVRIAGLNGYNLGTHTMSKLRPAKELSCPKC